MPKKSAKNSELLKSIKKDTTPQIYNMVLDLINEDRGDLAETVLKVDYLLDYAGTCIRQRDYEEAEEPLKMAKARIESLKEEKADIEQLEYLYQGLMKKMNR